MLVLIHRWMLTYLVTILRKLIKRRKDVSGGNRMIRKSHETRDRRNMSLRASFTGVTLPWWSLQGQFKIFLTIMLSGFLSHFGIVNSLFPRIAIMGDKKFPCHILYAWQADNNRIRAVMSPKCCHSLFPWELISETRWAQQTLFRFCRLCF